MVRRIEVNLNRQILTAYEGSNKVFEYDCATGDHEHTTHPGSFRIIRKHRNYTSKKYNVPMDFAMFFTHDGKAIHKSHLVGPISYLKHMGFGYFGSHGCVRLTEHDAQTLFDWAPLGTEVLVKNG